jgi:hypothetical protein
VNQVNLSQMLAIHRFTLETFHTTKQPIKNE